MTAIRHQCPACGRMVAQHGKERRSPGGVRRVPLYQHIDETDVYLRYCPNTVAVLVPEQEPARG